MQIFFAPVQGHTDAPYRHYHSDIYGGNLVYFTPFIRLEKNSIRPKDLKDLKSSLNDNHKLIPQIIFKDRQEITTLVNILKEKGIKDINLNMGCPFPLQTGHGRGSATIVNTDLAEAIKDVVVQNPEISFSVKMRLGKEDEGEWKNLLPHLNEINLSFIALHPRVAKQQYGGEINLEQFREFLNKSKNPVIYNGDIKTPDDIKKIIHNFKNIRGIMLGRGILGRPSLACEAISENEIKPALRIEKMLEFHNNLYQYYSSVLCGESQILSKIQPFWEYSEDEIGRKAWKAIKKASNLSKYQTAVALIQQSIL